MFVFTVVLGILCNYDSGLTCGTPGDRGECLLPIPDYCHDKGIHKSLLLGLAAGSVIKQRNTLDRGPGHARDPL